MKQLIYAISGYKNSGKTSMITSLIPLLTNTGLKVAVIKHDGHNFEGDVPGTDSFKAKQAGAYATAVFSNNRVLINKDVNDIDEQMLISAFPEADIILLEGFKNKNYPKYFCNYQKTQKDDYQKIFEHIMNLYNAIQDEETNA